MDDNPAFGFRIVSSFDAGSAYVASQSSSNYGGGTSRFDMVTISGTAIPAPGSVSLLGLGGLIAARRKRN